MQKNCGTPMPQLPHQGSLNQTLVQQTSAELGPSPSTYFSKSTHSIVGMDPERRTTEVPPITTLRLPSAPYISHGGYVRSPVYSASHPGYALHRGKWYKRTAPCAISSSHDCVHSNDQNVQATSTHLFGQDLMFESNRGWPFPFDQNPVFPKSADFSNYPNTPYYSNTRVCPEDPRFMRKTGSNGYVYSSASQGYSKTIEPPYNVIPGRTMDNSIYENMTEANHNNLTTTQNSTNIYRGRSLRNTRTSDFNSKPPRSRSSPRGSNLCKLHRRQTSYKTSDSSPDHPRALDIPRTPVSSRRSSSQRPPTSRSANTHRTPQAPVMPRSPEFSCSPGSPRNLTSPRNLGSIRILHSSGSPRNSTPSGARNGGNSIDNPRNLGTPKKQGTPRSPGTLNSGRSQISPRAQTNPRTLNPPRTPTTQRTPNSQKTNLQKQQNIQINHDSPHIPGSSRIPSSVQIQSSFSPCHVPGLIHTHESSQLTSSPKSPSTVNALMTSRILRTPQTPSCARYPQENWDHVIGLQHCNSLDNKVEIPQATSSPRTRYSTSALERQRLLKTHTVPGVQRSHNHFASGNIDYSRQCPRRDHMHSCQFPTGIKQVLGFLNAPNTRHTQESRRDSECMSTTASVYPSHIRCTPCAVRSTSIPPCTCTPHFSRKNLTKSNRFFPVVSHPENTSSSAGASYSAPAPPRPASAPYYPPETPRPESISSPATTRPSGAFYTPPGTPRPACMPYSHSGIPCPSSKLSSPSATPCPASAHYSPSSKSSLPDERLFMGSIHSKGTPQTLGKLRSSASSTLYKPRPSYSRRSTDIPKMPDPSHALIFNICANPPYLSASYPLPHGGNERVHVESAHHDLHENAERRREKKSKCAEPGKKTRSRTNARRNKRSTERRLRLSNSEDNRRVRLGGEFVSGPRHSPRSPDLLCNPPRIKARAIKLYYHP